MSFVHLHTHSEYSLLDGANRIDELVRRTDRLGMPAVALTDHGNLHGAWEFQEKARKQGIRPIIGCEAYVAYGDRTSKEKPPDAPAESAHLVLLAENRTGYDNLIKLSSIGYLDGFYRKPRIDHEALEEHAEGLIVLSACLSGEVARYLSLDRYEDAKRTAEWYASVFGEENYWLEVQDHGIEGQDRVNEGVFRLADEVGLGVVVTNDAHYLRREDADAHDTLLCIGTGKDKSDDDRLRFETEESYFKSPEEMAELFPDRPELMENTLRIAERCEVSFEESYHLPNFPLPERFGGDDAYLRHLAEEGARERYGEPIPDEVRERLDYELGVIEETGYAGYFLIVWDFIRAARERDIPVGPGRGSAAGSLVAYCLRVTDVDPLRFDLLFERFLNPERLSMPDIDIDFCYERRGEVIDYVRQKYGEKSVGQIITFGTMKARAVVRDVGRVLGFTPGETDRLAKLIPSGPGYSLTVEEAVEEVPELEELYRDSDRHRELLDYAMKIEGLSRHSSVHAAGVVIAPGPLTDYVPVCTDARDGEQTVVTQYDMTALEKAGMLKMDFLGLRTLTVIDDALETVADRHGVEVDWEDVGLQDPDVYEMLASGGTSGVFQFESALATEKLRAMRCDRFDDLIAVNALIRPGPLDSGMTDVYIKRKRGMEEVRYPHPALEEVLEPTFGIIVYQEQVMRIANLLAGYSLAEADVLRKAVGKKDTELIERELGKFRRRATEKGTKPSTARDLADQIETFGRYGFNKCLPGHVEILNPATGRLATIEELYREHPSDPGPVLACDVHSLRLQDASAVDIVDNGVRSVWRVRTESGREIEATANHPFLTEDGWTELADLSEGRHVAVPRQLRVEGSSRWARHEVVALGHLLAEGNLCHPSSVYFYSREEAALEDFVRAADAFENVRCTRGRHRGTGHVYAAREDRSSPPGIFTWASQLGLLGTTACDKEVPPEAFTLENDQLALLLGRMWTGDGHLNVRDGTLFYATYSHRLARQVLHILSRLGIIGRIRQVNFPYGEDGRTGWQVFVTGSRNVRRFAEELGPHLVGKERREAMEKILADLRDGGGSKDIVPVDWVRTRVRSLKETSELRWKDIEREAGVSTRDFLPTGTNPNKVGFRRSTVRAIGEFFQDSELSAAGSSDILWDRIAEIEYVGEKRTYDLEVPVHHNFVANDFVVHNSHSAAYSLLSYRTAWLKAHYPAEFMAALLSSEIGDTDKVVAYIAEARELGIEVLPPNVNESGYKFTVVDDDRIRFGLGAIKGVGESAIRSIQEARDEEGEFTSLFDFCCRVDLRLNNKRAQEAMIQAGAMDDLGDRAAMAQGLDAVMSEAQLRKREEAAGQGSLFGGDAGPERPRPELPDVDAWGEKERLAREKEVLGFYTSGHPLDRFEEMVRRYAAAVNTSNLVDHRDSSVELACVVTEADVRTSRRDGREYGRLTLEDYHGTATGLVFGDAWQEHKRLLIQDAPVLVKGRVSGSSRDEDDPPIFVDSARRLSEIRTSGRVAVCIELQRADDLDPEVFGEVRRRLEASPGAGPVYVDWRNGEEGGNGAGPTRLASRTLKVEPSRDLLEDLRALLGRERVRFETE